MLASSTASFFAAGAVLLAFFQGKVEVPSYGAALGVGGFSHGWQMGHSQPEPLSVETCSCHCVCPPASRCSIVAAVIGGDAESKMELALVAVILVFVWSCGWCCAARCGAPSRERDFAMRAGGRQLALAGGDGALASRGLIVRRR